LAELLLAMGVLAILMTFNIHKILNAQVISQKKAVMKETLGALNQVTFQATQDRVADELVFWTQLTTTLNVVKNCPTNGIAEGCWAPGVAPATKGMVLHNGALIYPRWTPTPTIQTALYIDWNGAKGPNAYGGTSWATYQTGDVYNIDCFYGNPATASFWETPLRRGACMPAVDDPNLAAYLDLYD
jgi:hypothetical protein